ncbi:mannitol dehydrogenase family protein [Methylovirgula sp. 4M-Z18]|uniref:mannitol dehydrogenase family protein n=1 Tax=Methylovirgula sp. 4M-Z18 TaxID=2293567 RepID=UPI000E2E548F|nr:mannitol dehydrogenase family protein [Methylovirgula sp. 4M-Z18]RFB80282.1 mannitol dehydrogenase family protein [Methylovirgula sp. 4M-Z18]
MTHSLRQTALPDLPPHVIVPTYDRAALSTGIVHLGIGAFHRAHQAAYTEAALQAGDLRWGILGVSLRSPDTRDALHPQDGLYTLSIRDAKGDRPQVIGAVRDVVVAPEDPCGVVAAMANPSVKIVSLTVTEKGYCHDPATGTLREDHPDIVHDLNQHLEPKSAPGFIVSALAKRRSAGIPPFTVLCCDNLPANGKTVRRVVTRFAELLDADLAAFIAEHVAFPCTMVDRIVPATTDDDRTRITDQLGLRDAWPVMTEPFTQWVIEDHFPQGRPDWGLLGAEFTRDVAPYELMKLRLLNGSHSCIAYLGYLAGYETVADTMSDRHFARFIRGLMDAEVSPVLAAPPGADVEAYKSALIQRFHNPALKHRTWQIAMDGSQKIPQRWLGTIRECLAKDIAFPRLALGIAAWMRYVSGTDEIDQPIDVRDPLADKLRERAATAENDPEKLAYALLQMDMIFGHDFIKDPRFVDAVTWALAGLMQMGAKNAVKKLAADL